jgi:hypothetical protein
MLKMASSFVLSRPSPATYPRGYASIAGLPAALLEDHFEHLLFEIRQGMEPDESYTAGR